MRAYLHDGQEPNEVHRPATLSQDQIPPSSPISLATHRRSIHLGQTKFRGLETKFGVLIKLSTCACRRSPLGLGQPQSTALFLVPLENLGTVPVNDTLMAIDILVYGFEILYAMGLARDIGVDRHCHYARPGRALRMESVEVVRAALLPVGRLVMLDDHHGDVVELHRVRQGDERSLRRRNDRWLVVIHPVAHVLDAGRGKVFRRVVGLRQSWAEPADRRLARELTNDLI